MLNGIKNIIRGEGYYEFVTPDGMVFRMADEELPYKNLIDEASEMVGDTNPRTRLPRTGGTWEGTPGDGKWFSDKPEVKAVTGGQPVEFTNGRPNFKPWSKGTLQFPEGALKGTLEDFDLVYDKIKELKGFSSRTQAKDWLREKGLTPHHQNSTDIELIPTDLHGNVPHIGAASDLRGGY